MKKLRYTVKKLIWSLQCITGLGEVFPSFICFGDCAQLPPLMMTALYDEKAAKPNTADLLGKIAIAQFLDPSNKRQCK